MMEEKPVELKKMSKKNKIVLTSMLMGVLLIFGAITYAYFTTNVKNNGQQLTIQSGTLVLTLDDTKESNIIKKTIGIGDTIEKDMVITNNGSVDTTAIILWNELENNYQDGSLSYTVKQTEEYDKGATINPNTLDYNINAPQVSQKVPRSEEPAKLPLSGKLNIPAGKKIYCRVAITYEHLEDVNQDSDAQAQISTSFTIEEGGAIEKTIVLGPSNLSLVGFTGAANEELVIPSTVKDDSGVWHRVTGIDNYAFKDCTNLVSVTIPDTVTSIGLGAFFNCSSLTSVSIPNSVTSIMAGSFTGCSSLSTITIPGSVTNNMSNEFTGCSSLTSINVALTNPKYKSVDGVLFTKDGKKLIACPAGKTGIYTVPDGVTQIGDYSFEKCNNLTSIILPNSVTSIGEEAICQCKNLTSIEISDNVSNIGYHAFFMSTKLATIKYKGTAYTSKSAFKTAFTSTAGNTIDDTALDYTRLSD